MWEFSVRKQLPDEKTLLEVLQEIREFEHSAREICELSTAIAYKYQSVSKSREVASKE